jgi:hypothetical protein
LHFNGSFARFATTSEDFMNFPLIPVRKRSSQLNATKCFVQKAAVEVLEQRRLLAFSISAGALEGPITTAGSTWMYQSGSSGGDMSVEVITVGSPTTFQGHSVIAATDNTTATTVTPPTTVKVNSTLYGATLATGPVIYGGTGTDSGPKGSGEGTITYSPPEQLLPAVVTVGVAYTFKFAEMSSTTGTAIIENFTYVDTLVSSSTTSVTVPAGTFNCYEIDQTITENFPGTNPITTTKHVEEFCAPGIGVVEKDYTDANSQAPLELTSVVTKKDTLKFKQGPSETEAGNDIKPPIVVEIDGQNGSVDSTGGDASDFVTLTVTGGGVTLGGTTTVQAVGGLATFSDISMPAAGTYTLTASSDPMTPVTSDILTIDASTPSELNPTLPRLRVPTTAVGGGPININASITVTNSTASTVTGNAQVSAFLVGPTGEASAIAIGADFVGSPDTVSLQIGKTVTQKVNLKPHQASHVTLHLTKLPSVTVAGTYTLQFVVTDPKGNSTTVMGPSLTVGPATVAVTPTISSFTPPTSSGKKTKAGTMKIVLKNTGNIPAKGKVSFAITGSATSGVLGTAIESTSQKVNLAVGKSATVNLKLLTLGTLTTGSYFFVVQVTDPAGHTTLASSSKQFSVA